MINTTDSASTNVARILGEVRSELFLSHITYGEAFYTFAVGVERNSGYEDRIIVMASERILSAVDVKEGIRLDIQGQVRTYNEEINGHNRLNIVIFAQDILITDEEMPVNDIYLKGHLCKKPLQRTSPLGRKICDLMLAVNRMYNKSDYIPCIAWGRNAVYSGTMNVGGKIAVRGRLQSRQYRKKLEDGSFLTKIAYEVSVLQLEIFEEDMV